MEYNKFKGKKLESFPWDRESVIEGFVARISLLFGGIGMLLFRNTWIGFISLCFFAFGFSLDYARLEIRGDAYPPFWKSLSVAINNHKVIKTYEQEGIKEKLLLEELPVDVDLADYFKQREIDLLEAEVKRNIDLMKKQYLRGVN